MALQLMQRTGIETTVMGRVVGMEIGLGVALGMTLATRGRKRHLARQGKGSLR